MSASLIVVGQVARDLVLKVDAMPDAGGSSSVVDRIEILGGKGANQAVAAAQLGAAAILIGVVGHDTAGDDAIDRARDDGIDVRNVVRRDEPTALLVDVVDAAGHNRLFEYVPEAMLLTPADVYAAEPRFRDAETVLVQLQQPPASCLAAVELACKYDRRVVLDGALADTSERQQLLAVADVLRADSREAELMVGRSIASEREAVSAARVLMGRGPKVVILAVGSESNVVVSAGGVSVARNLPVEVVDPTGGGDSFVAAFTVSLARGEPVPNCLRAATAAAASTVSRLGGRPQLSVPDLADISQHVESSCVQD
ncbi:MAG: PfkB family carbohydrate kinase [Acidothermaceae bacterium]